VGGGGGGGETVGSGEEDNGLRFEQMHRVEGVPNRMAIYPQDVLHNAWTEDQGSGSVPVLPCSATKGRLAISLFFLSRHGGLGIVDELSTAWKEEAIQKLTGGSGGGHDFGLGLQRVREGEEEARRGLIAWRRLGACASFTKGAIFNVVAAGCDLGVTTTVNSGERLRVKGLEGVDHPELNRGGVAASNGHHKYDRHFVVDGTAKLTLMNLKLSGAWVGYTDQYGCGYCERRVSCCTCGLELYFTVLRVARSFIVLSLMLLHSCSCCLLLLAAAVVVVVYSVVHLVVVLYCCWWCCTTSSGRVVCKY
jgi:hypothetical protein